MAWLRLWWALVWLEISLVRMEWAARRATPEARKYRDGMARLKSAIENHDPEQAELKLVIEPNQKSFFQCLQDEAVRHMVAQGELMKNYYRCSQDAREVAMATKAGRN